MLQSIIGGMGRLCSPRNDHVIYRVIEAMKYALIEDEPSRCYSKLTRIVLALPHDRRLVTRDRNALMLCRKSFSLLLVLVLLLPVGSFGRRSVRKLRDLRGRAGILSYWGR